MDTVYTYTGMAVVWAVIVAAVIVLSWLVYIYSVGFARSVRFILWCDRHARKDPAVGLTLWEKVRGVFCQWHHMTVFNPDTDSIQLKGGTTFRG